jgi:hypothetical protein
MFVFELGGLINKLVNILLFVVSRLFEQLLCKVVSNRREVRDDDEFFKYKLLEQLEPDEYPDVLLFSARALCSIVSTICLRPSLID